MERLGCISGGGQGSQEYGGGFVYLLKARLEPFLLVFFLSACLLANGYLGKLRLHGEERLHPKLECPDCIDEGNELFAHIGWVLWGVKGGCEVVGDCQQISGVMEESIDSWI